MLLVNLTTGEVDQAFFKDIFKEFLLEIKNKLLLLSHIKF